MKRTAGSERLRQLRVDRSDTENELEYIPMRDIILANKIHGLVTQSWLRKEIDLPVNQAFERTSVAEDFLMRTNVGGASERHLSRHMPNDNVPEHNRH